MERKNTLLLTVIAIATLLVAVVGATFAYFASETNVNATANVTATTGQAATFSSSSDDALELNITADLMTKAAASNEPLAQTDDANLIITLSAAAGTKCTYNIGYVNTAEGEENVYVPVTPTTDAADYEFEILASYCQADDCTGDDAQWNTYPLDEETNGISYSQLLSGTAEIPYYLIRDIEISVPADDDDPETPAPTTATPVTWKFTANFYNLNAQQATGKNYSGYFVVTNDVVC